MTTSTGSMRRATGCSEYRGTGRPLLGICGGHQMIAELEGAPVEQIAGGQAGRDHAGQPHRRGPRPFPVRGLRRSPNSTSPTRSMSPPCRRARRCWRPARNCPAPRSTMAAAGIRSSSTRRRRRRRWRSRGARPTRNSRKLPPADERQPAAEGISWPAPESCEPHAARVRIIDGSLGMAADLKR